MQVYAGIDEAGYGPIVGPLCVACSCFVVGEEDGSREPGTGNRGEVAPPPDLWKLLKRAVCKKVGDSRGRIAVDDSKALKGANDRASRHPLADLERGVLAFLACVDQRTVNQDSDTQNLPCDCGELLSLLSAAAPPMQWYASPNVLPVGLDAALARIAASRLRNCLDETKTQIAFMQCDVVDAGEVNRRLKLFKNKAEVNMLSVMRLVERVRQFAAQRGANPHIVIDRQGGRTHYRDHLQTTWPEAKLRILEECDDFSQYEVDLGSSEMTLSFRVQAEKAHLPVALASMTAKYVRELMMLRFNTYFRKHQPELKPTAGYYKDGKRFLKDIEPLITRLKLPSAELVRRS